MLGKIIPALLVSCALSGAADALWTEGFENTFPPAGWAENSVDQSPSYSFSGTNSAKLGASGDYLITPQLTNTCTLIFWTYTTSADPDIVVEYATSASGPWTETTESPLSGYTQQWNGQSIDLTLLNEPYIRFRKSGTGSLYIDDISAERASAVSNQPPVLAAVDDQTVFEGSGVSFTVTASDPGDGDLITLTATNLPTGAVFSGGTFTWSNAAPAGAYDVTFTATDKDGSDNESVTITVTKKPVLFISEIADPAGTGADAYRFVELYNAGSSAVDLADGNWHLSKQVNGGTWYDIPLTGTIAAEQTFVAAYNTAEFQTAYGFAPDQEDGDVSSNGDDAYFLYSGGDHDSGTLIDIYGEFDTDGTGTTWDYEDSRAVRNNNILEPNTTWTASEWTITAGATTNDMTPGAHGPAPELQGLENQFVFLGDDLHLLVTAVNTVKTDTITLSATVLPAGAVFPQATGTNSVSSTLSWTAPPAGVYTVSFATAGLAGTTTESITVTVAGTAEIDGKFYGWKSGTIVKLDNGQFWRNTGGAGSITDPPLRNPQVSVTHVLGTRRMFVETVASYTTVEQINVAESRLESTFTGLHNGNIYELADGTFWEQISFENISSSADPVTIWRWTENSKTYMRFLDRDDVNLGTCQVAASTAPTGGPIITEIDGWFRGWKNKRVFALANGQFWQQTVANSSIDTLNRPTATLTNYLGTGTWRLTIDGTSAPGYVEVQQLTNVTRTAIDGGFYGFGNGEFFHLQNGEWWRQTSLDTSASTRSNPEVLLWSESGIDTIEMPDEGRAVTAEPLAVLAESSVTNDFSGLHYANRYELASGENWMQISFENTPNSTLTPETMLWSANGQTNLLLRSESDATIGSCEVVDPDADGDGDQIANADEIIAGTDLANAGSFFGITETQVDGRGHYTLNWTAAEGRRYTILWATALDETFHPQGTVDAPTNSWTDIEHTTDTKGFYKIGVRLIP